MNEAKVGLQLVVAGASGWCDPITGECHVDTDDIADDTVDDTVDNSVDDTVDDTVSAEATAKDAENDAAPDLPATGAATAR